MSYPAQEGNTFRQQALTELHHLFPELLVRNLLKHDVRVHLLVDKSHENSFLQQQKTDVGMLFAHG